MKQFKPEVGLETFSVLVGRDMFNGCQLKPVQNKEVYASKESREACSPTAMSTMPEHCTAPINH